MGSVLFGDFVDSFISNLSHHENGKMMTRRYILIFFLTPKFVCIRPGIYGNFKIHYRGWNIQTNDKREVHPGTGYFQGCRFDAYFTIQLALSNSIFKRQNIFFELKEDSNYGESFVQLSNLKGPMFLSRITERFE